MKKKRPSLTAPERPLPMHAQVTRQLRERILGGELKPGTLLPTMHQLAAEYETSYFTIQTALTPLVEEGLVERKRRVGTIVRHNPAILTTAGIYCSSGLLDEWEFAFHRELCRQLQQQLGEQGVETMLHADIRPLEARHTPLPALVEAIDKRRCQALFVALCDQVSLAWLRRLPVVASFVTAEAIANRVTFDADQMLRLALARLRDRGCTRVGLISAVKAPPEADHEFRRFYDSFVAAIAELGLTTRDTWVMTPAEPVTHHERFGYASCKALWEQAERPDGLFVYPDTSARGAMMALLELGVRVPDDLRVVCHRNTGVAWICPLPVDWVESDVARWAAEMIRQVRRQQAGEPAEQSTLPYRLCLHAPTGQDAQ